MSVSRFSLAIRKTVITEVFGDKDWAYFWEARFLPRWLPLLLGSGLGLALAFMIVGELWHFVIPLALAVPLVILFNSYPFIGVMLWMLIVPYFLNEPTSSGRYVYWIVHRATLPTALGVLILSSRLGIRKKAAIRLGRAELAMLIFLGLILANIFLFSGKPIEMIISAYDRIFIPFCIYWVIRFYAPSEKDLKRFLWVALITLVAQAVIGIISWFAPEMLPDKWLGLEGDRTVGSLRNVAVYTSTLLFSSLLLFHYAVHCKAKWLRLWLFFTFGLAFYCIFMSFSRGSWLGASAVLVVLILIYPKVMIRVTIILGILIFIMSGSILADQVTWGYERLSGEAAQRSAESRMTANDASVSMLKARPFLGWGYGNYDQAKQPFMRRVGNIRVYDVTSHNTYLTILAEFGLIGFAFYFFPVGWWLMLSLKAWGRMPRQGFWSRRLLMMLWLAILHIFIVTHFMDMVRSHWFGTTLWWMVLGLIANIVYQHLIPGDIGATNLARQSSTLSD